MIAGRPATPTESLKSSPLPRESEMSDQSMSAETAEQLRRSALAHLWTHNGAWNEMAEEGLPFIAVKGKG